MKKLSFSVDTKGNATIKDACGFGHGCQEATQDIERLLGNADESSRATTDSAFAKVDDLVLKNEA